MPTLIIHLAGLEPDLIVRRASETSTYPSQVKRADAYDCSINGLLVHPELRDESYLTFNRDRRGLGLALLLRRAEIVRDDGRMNGCQHDLQIVDE